MDIAVRICASAGCGMAVKGKQKYCRKCGIDRANGKRREWVLRNQTPERRDKAQIQIYHQKYYLKNKEEMKAYQQKYYLKNKEKINREKSERYKLNKKPKQEKDKRTRRKCLSCNELFVDDGVSLLCPSCGVIISAMSENIITHYRH
jgi:predicted RNA-binding Zn-ribbon protein involved in translation (DUF1610 family)